MVLERVRVLTLVPGSAVVRVVLLVLVVLLALVAVLMRWHLVVLLALVLVVLMPRVSPPVVWSLTTFALSPPPPSLSPPKRFISPTG